MKGLFDCIASCNQNCSKVITAHLAKSCLEHESVNAIAVKDRVAASAQSSAVPTSDMEEGRRGCISDAALDLCVKMAPPEQPIAAAATRLAAGLPVLDLPLTCRVPLHL